MASEAGAGGRRPRSLIAGAGARGPSEVDRDTIYALDPYGSGATGVNSLPIPGGRDPILGPRPSQASPILLNLTSESSPPVLPLFRIGSVVSDWSHQFSAASRSPIHWESAVSLAEREIRQRQHQPSSLSLACAPPQAHLIPRYCPLGLEIPPPSAEWLASQNPPPSAEWIAAQGLLSLARSGPRQSPSPAPQV